MFSDLTVKPGPKPKGKVAIKWSSNFAYAIGLIATDGSLAIDHRHIDFTSKDLEQILNFKKALGLGVKVGTKNNGTGKLSYRIQFGDVLFFKFLESIGLHPAKSLTMGALIIPDEFFADFLRGCFDGDGSMYSYYDKRWRSSFMFYMSFASASPLFLAWIRTTVLRLFVAKGHITSVKGKSCLQLKYSKHETVKIVARIYAGPDTLCLSRKRLKIEQSLAMMSKPQDKGAVGIDKYARVL